ncbi:hypothetical protein SOV_25500 [Sporomusa ovata DSM 2662]|uniref:Uncharacterized protein n=1 Tax=Sporomusa ovata TaxID=2378 RepID=A0A0U1L403_9FIRM|nr:hypothetical protein [Sporomusa ovata]EQB25863.1 hypothetical protein SOV_4c05300 [Sporomusa ovata DSM 2662]CQR74431.1 hypothetical protein SpAn4DRAFT_0893 [Sporomusa ovata]
MQRKEKETLCLPLSWVIWCCLVADGGCYHPDSQRAGHGGRRSARPGGPPIREKTVRTQTPAAGGKEKNRPNKKGGMVS